MIISTVPEKEIYDKKRIIRNQRKRCDERSDDHSMLKNTKIVDENENNRT